MNPEAMSKLKPIRVRVPGVIDVLVISDPEHIRWLNQREEVVRPLDPSVSWLHRFIDQRLSKDLAFVGGLLPVFRARSDAERAASQKDLEKRLEHLRGAPGPERDEIADYVSGEKDAEEIGVTVQQWCGKLFFAHYRALKETYVSGRRLATWPSAPPWRTWKERANHCLAKSKNEVSAAAQGDLHCIHATSIGMENVARSVRKLRDAARDPDKRQLSPDDILRHCLTAPPALLRGCTRSIDVPFLDQPITRQSVIVFLVARAYAASGDLDDAFLANGWSACPAREVIPEMLRAVWHSAHHDVDARDRDSDITEIAQKRVASTIHTIHGITRIWQRAVS